MRRRVLLTLLFLSGCSSGGLTKLSEPATCTDQAAAPALHGETMSVLSLNVAHGRGQAMNQIMVSTEKTRLNLNLIARTLDTLDADVVALQEADGASLWSGSFDHVQYLRERSGLACAFLGRHSDTWLASYGTALLSRASLRDSVSVKFPSTPPTASKGFVMAEISWRPGERATPITVVSAHLDFSRKSVRDKQVAILLAELANIETPLVLMGDMNSYWDAQRSHVRQLAEGLHLKAYAPASDALGTYKSGAGTRLDWILVSRELEFTDYRVLPDQLSDHLAVFAQLRLRSREEL